MKLFCRYPAKPGIFILTMLILAPFAGCGDASKDFEVRGTLVSTSGAPVEDITVSTVDAMTETDVTDANGNFSLQTETPGNRLKLMVQSEDFSALPEITGIPPEAAAAVVSLQLDPSTNAVALTAVQFLTE